ncbi:LysR family transcriptional regulator [Phytoactinopolyspora halotolerans]|uniref:LysR family transcriptional regulator n=1 Tax=Phytoactinopolyspora halotolerans TaxID=1981512 RepID=A0A6L9SB82_9ACTN|nr:LysR family transcriptional regulator [Phytoactinopolyspora halotolerans]NEE01822.1 LysR family transcriptional regulator [Phytoactinopolyspora halotolerans]
MDLVRHLEYFTTIAHERHFGRAAERLGIRQPPLSQGLKRLEAELGLRLCERDSRGVTLTDAGLALLPAAHRVLDEVEQLRLLARRREEPARARVTVRIAPGLGGAHYSALVAACHRVVPGADVDIDEQSTADQIGDLHEGRADIGVLREPVVARGLTIGPQIGVVVNCLLPAVHPAAHSGRVRLRDLSGHHLVLPPRQHAPAAHDDVVATCERHGFLPESVAEVADERLVRGLVAAGTHVAFTTDPPRADGDSVVVALDGEPLSLLLRIAWRGDLSEPLADLPKAIVRALSRQTDSAIASAGISAGTSTGTRASAEDASPAMRRPRAVSELPAADA